MSDTTENTSAPKEQTLYGKCVGTFIAVLNAAGTDGHGLLDKGDLASLRRMDTLVPAPAFWKLAAASGDAIGRYNEQRWALVAKCMAVMAPFHQKDIRPGIALRDAGFSRNGETRITRLLKAGGENFDDYALSACRYMASKAAGFDWYSFARFLVERDERSRNALARDFYSFSSKDGDKK